MRSIVDVMPIYRIDRASAQVFAGNHLELEHRHCGAAARNGDGF